MNKISRGLLFFMMMSVAMLVACSESESTVSEKSKENAINKEGFPIVDEPIEMTMFGPNHGLAEWEDMLFSKRWRK
ncbi:hypothetical protein G4V62_02765 [Bacillaceae bacterium SIJ1]|uniref:hypothetical protein n=1 Tax=Litoribacterium kuwaitense TaxID=1398745 RepID=UPI0013EA4E2C|nr:hypothetical protein [Litoribacterium kuwaitense]NGP43922.1 hypothetical protein [Litoribacterium kuwaitense]